MTSKLIAVGLAFFFIGCTTVKASQDGPWSDYLREAHGLTDCQRAAESYKIADALDDKFQAILDNPKIPPEVKTVVKAEQEGIWHLEEDLIMWKNTNCKEI